jgi:Fe-S-cluster containining protein
MTNTFFNKLDNLYIKMDKAYTKAASHYGFECNGCEDNCCRSFFHHHTFIEKDYLLSKANELAPETKKILKKSAALYLDSVSQDGAAKEGRPLCPLNKDDKCILYSVRPMICRLHGIPHHLNIPGRAIKENPGCDAGASFFNSKDYYAFDRIPYYKEMVEIEKEYRKAIGKSDKIKVTISHMLLDIEG